MSATLPEGWKALQAPDGRPYYANTVTGATQWVPPTAPATAAPARAPAAPVAAAPAPAQAPAAAPAGAGTTADARYTLGSLVARTGQRDLGQGFFELERDKLLEINLGAGADWAWIRHGTMVARRGNVKFTRQSMKEQGFAKIMKKAFTGEGVSLIKCEGRGKVFVADAGKVVSVLSLQNQSLSVNGNDVLAMSGALKYDIKLMRNAGVAAGGLFNCRVSGTGLLAFTCHGSVVTLAATQSDPVYTDPNATVAWTHDPTMVSDFGVKALFGRTTGEEFQLCFRQGHVIIQPYEELSPFAQSTPQYY